MEEEMLSSLFLFLSFIWGFLLKNGLEIIEKRTRIRDFDFTDEVLALMQRHACFGVIQAEHDESGWLKSYSFVHYRITCSDSNNFVFAVPKQN